MSGPAVAPEPLSAPAVPWQRLDARMLLVHPVLELVRFLPVLVGILVLGSQDGPEVWQLLGVALPIVLGVLRFLTTRFRITPTQVELQRGLVGRTVLTARLDRVRAVELTSSPIHRVLGLAKVEIGTAAGGQGEDAFALDSLGRDDARRLRVALLHRGGVAEEPAAAGATAAAYDEVLLRLDPRWARYAPLTASGNVVAAGLVAASGQLVDRLGARVLDEGHLVGRLLQVAVPVLVAYAVGAFLVLGAVIAVLGYLVGNWGFTLTRDTQGRSFHVRRGLLTSTETSLERERVRGLEVSEPLGLRLVGAGRLAAVVTGLSRSERSSTQLVPPAPRTVVDAVGVSVLGDDHPLAVPLRSHGPAARRRRWTRALGVAVLLPLALLLLAALGVLPWWTVLPALLALPVAAALAADRHRRLGHALTHDHVVIRWGSLRGRRDVLQRTGIIGWDLRQSFFQRRAGLVTLVALTAAGRQAYELLDVPEAEAVALADDAVPGLLEPFLSVGSRPASRGPWPPHPSRSGAPGRR